MKKVPADKIFTAVLQAAAAIAVPFVIIANVFPTVDKAVILEGIAHESTQSSALESVSESFDKFIPEQSSSAENMSDSETISSMPSENQSEPSDNPGSSMSGISSTASVSSSSSFGTSSSVSSLSTSSSASGASKPAQSSQSTSGKININSASLEQLKTLSGIGDVKAQAIIDYREQNGGFKSIDELINVKGIGASTLEKVRDYVTV